jgi:hypothetical protein
MPVTTEINEKRAGLSGYRAVFDVNQNRWSNNVGDIAGSKLLFMMCHGSVYNEIIALIRTRVKYFYRVNFKY